jgi:hypothetical protein
MWQSFHILKITIIGRCNVKLIMIMLCMTLKYYIDVIKGRKNLFDNLNLSTISVLGQTHKNIKNYCNITSL